MLLLALACAGPDDTVDGSDTADSAAEDAPIPWSYALDDTLRITDAQVVATHNSYHVAPDPYVVPDWDYTMPTLTAQLALGVRSFELDIHQEDGDLRVYHVAALDETATCDTLATCLDELAAWSTRNPAHLPLYVQIEIKDDTGGDPFTNYDLLDETLLAHGPPAFTPADMRGDHGTLAEALADGGWPTLGEMRGRAFYGLDDREEDRDAYRARGEGPVFVSTSPGDTDAAVAILNSATHADLPAALAAGMLVRVFADGARESAADNAVSREAALASGAHVLSTDYPDAAADQAAFTIPEGSPAGCNPVTAPPECTAAALEDPSFIRN